MGSRKSIFLGGMLVLGMLCVFGCSSDDDPVTPPPAGGSATIGVAGGTLSVPGDLTMTVPQDALVDDVDFTAKVNSSPPAGPVGYILLSDVYSIEPSGTLFAELVALTMEYSEGSLGGASEDDIILFTNSGSGWEELDNTVDTAENSVEAAISHLSDFVVAVPTPPEPDPVFAQLIVHREITAEDIPSVGKELSYSKADQIYAAFNATAGDKPVNPLQAESVSFGTWDLVWEANAYWYTDPLDPAFLTLGGTYDFVVVGNDLVPSLNTPVTIMSLDPYVTNLTPDQEIELVGFTLEWTGTNPSGTVDIDVKGTNNALVKLAVPNTGTFTFTEEDMGGFPTGPGSISLNLIAEAPIEAEGYTAESRVQLTTVNATDVVFTGGGTVIDETTVVSSVGRAIPDATTGGAGTPVTDIINVPVTGVVDSVLVYLDISHNYMSDLIVRLTSPDGTELRVMFIGEGGETDGRIQGWYPGDFVPKDDLNGFDGESAGGDWTVKAQDYSRDIDGTFNEWRLRIFYAH